MEKTEGQAVYCQDCVFFGLCNVILSPGEDCLDRETKEK